MRKRFGQHFLKDSYYLDQIIKAISPQPTEHLVEVGPGKGALTHYLLQTIPQLEAIEIDRDLVAYLENKYTTSLRLHNQDATSFDFNKVYTGKKIRLVGNLPYNVSTPLLFHFFNFLPLFEDMHFLLQKEVVDRMCASPGSKAYGRLSLSTQLYCESTALFEVPPEAFSPAPKVQSAVVRLQPKSQDFSDVFKIQFYKLAKQAFQQRRKTLANNLKPLLSAETLLQLSINPQKRPETVSLTDFIRICEYMTLNTPGL